MAETEIQLTHFAGRQAFDAAVEALLRDEISKQRNAAAGLMLAGGSTPFRAYAAIAKSHPEVVNDSLHFLFSDERHVAIDSAQNNCANISPMFFAMGLGADRILRVDSEMSLEDAADDYHNHLEDFLYEGGTLPLGLLGIGGDGHTASLFSLEDVDRGEGRWTIPVVKEEKPDRISVTSGFLREFERIIFLVADRSKDDVIVQLLRDPESIPAGKAVQGVRQVDLWVMT